MKIGVIMGGISSEREISLMTGREIVKNLDKNKYEVIPVEINSTQELADKVKGLDFAFIALHGKFGEDGRVQAVLESMEIPYSGSGVLASAVCMDKNMSKKLFVNDKIGTAKWEMVKEREEVDYEKIEKLGYPLIVKPNSGGSSVATLLVQDRKNLEDSIKEALKYDNEVMIEEYIKGDEITCCILDGTMLPVLLIKPKCDEFFDYESKYNNGGAEEKVIKLPAEIMKNVESACLKCWDTFKLKAYSRVDIILRDGEVYVLEINTLPGMTRNSLFPKSALNYGIEFSELLEKIININL